MFVTVHPLDRVYPPEVDRTTGWPDQVRLMLPGTPVAHWVGVQLGSSTGSLVAFWATQAEADAAALVEGATATRVTVSPSTVHALDVVELAAGQAQAPGVMQLTWFAGPRTPAHVHAARLADRRIAAVLRDLPGLCGAAILSGRDNARLVISFADSEATLRAALVAIMATELGPDEDAALLPGPDLVQISAVVAGSGPIDVLSGSVVGSVVGGGVR